MKIIKPVVEFITPINEEAVLKRLEECGRVCYKSEHSIKEGSAETFVRGIIARGHEAVLEHCSFTVRFTVDRGISHEIVRHRMASYCQESTRYCNYSQDKFDNEITVIEPCSLRPGTSEYELWRHACLDAEDYYFELLRRGCAPQIARLVLPTSLKTELVMTANIREWRYFLNLRTGSGAHPQMREIATMLLEKCAEGMPVLFGDIHDAVCRREGLQQKQEGTND